MTGMRVSTGLALMAALGLLAGCNKPKTPEGGAASSEMAKPATLADANPMAQKPGLWEIATAIPGMSKGIVSQLCVDQGLSGRMAEIGIKGMGDTHCSHSNIIKAASAVDVDSVCQMSGRTVTSHIHMEMISDSEYHQTIASTLTPPISGDGKSETTVVGKRTGDCPADMKGGDMVMPGGMKMNMYDALNRATASK